MKPGSYKLSIRRPKNQTRKSRPMEKYYWPVVVRLAADELFHSGYLQAHANLMALVAEADHEIVKALILLGSDKREAAHEILLLENARRRADGTIIRTSDEDFTLDVQMQYIERCVNFLGGEGIRVPSPGEYDLD